VIVYLDTSIILRVLLGQAGTFARWGRWAGAFASEIMGVEARRAVDRLRLEGVLDDEGVVAMQDAIARTERTLALVPVSRAVLRRASLPLATPVRTLDALHLATALMVQERREPALVFATHDGRQAAAAAALGFSCVGV
jgi:predicted nucleic acid-binding protein